MPARTASAADRTLIQSVIDAGGALTLVLQPLADGIEYRKDWHDITHGTPPVLEIFFGSPCYPTTLVLPEARAGEPYSASLSASSECLAGLQWSLAGCTLPEGLTLSPAGIISGTPSWAGTWTFRVRGGDGRGPHESDLSLTVGASKADLDGDGDVDAGDFAVFQADVTGPGTGNIDLCWRTYVRKCLDTLIEHGTDRYGSVSTPMLMAVIDVNSLTAPENPPLYDDYVRTEGRPSHGRWSPGGSNLWLDQPLIRTMYRFSEVSGDPKYAAAADAYVNAYLTRARKPNGMMYWGSHSYYHGYSDGPAGDGLHEILILHPEWQRMHQLQPEIIKGLIDGIWDWHIVNHQTGQHNRHDDASYGCDFAFSGGSFIMAFAYMAAATGDPAYMDKAKLVAEWHWSHRHPVTGLIPDSPGVTSRYDSQYSFTCDSGPYAAQLLSSSELTGDPTFRDQAIAIIKAYDHYAYDAAAVNYWAMLGLDGTPFPAQPKGGGYDIWIPSGHVDVWRTIMFSYEFAVEAAEASLYAWEQSGPTVAARDPELLAIARRWGEVLRRNMAPSLGRRWKAEVEEAMPAVKQTGGTYAENYGRAISFYVNLYHATGDQRDLRLAKRLAREAIEKLYANGLFKGHPAKPHYQSNDGVGFLLHALMQLDALPGAWRLAF